MKRALVIGGSGFLGSHVADQLVLEGYRVSVFDRSVSPYLQSPEQEMTVGDILDVEAVHAAVEGSDVVYNFAGLSDLNEGLGHPAKAAELNIVGNINILNACVAHKVERFIYASTIYVHGNLGGFYRCSKASAESFVEEFQRQFGLKYTILRYGSLFGPRSDMTNGLHRLVKNALETGVLQYKGAANTTREYIYVEDAARASVSALNDEFINRALCISGYDRIKIEDLLSMIEEILVDHDLKIELQDTKYPGHYVYSPYTYQSKTDLKYVSNTHVDFGQALLRLIEFLRS